MRRVAVIGVLLCAGAVVVPAEISAASDRVSANPGIAALQVALRARGTYKGPIDGIAGPGTRAAVVVIQQKKGLAPDGIAGPATRRALGPLGRPLLGQRPLTIGQKGWDVASLEFRLRGFGLPLRAIDGRFTPATAAALRRFQDTVGLTPDGIAGPLTFRALARGKKATPPKAAPPKPVQFHVVAPGEGLILIARQYGVGPLELAGANGLTLRSVILPGQRLGIPESSRHPTAVHVVEPGEGWFVIAQRYRVSPYDLAQLNGSSLSAVIVPGQRLQLPAGAVVTPEPAHPVGTDVPSLLDHWSAVFGVDPKLARAVSWMESGFQQDVVSDIGAVGVMQLLPETWDWVDSALLGHATSRTAAGNVEAGVRFLRWQLDEFDGDVGLALAGWYQGARAVRQIGLYDDTKQFVSVVEALHGRV